MALIRCKDWRIGAIWAALIAIPLIVSFVAVKFDRSGHPGRSGGAAPVNGRVVAELRSEQSQCRTNLRRLETSGTVRISDSKGVTAAAFDEAGWSVLQEGDKVRLALVIYCAKMPDDGRYRVMIRGLYDGSSLARVVNGNYWD